MKKIYTQKQLSSYKNFKRNVLERGGVGKILDRKSEQMEFYGALKEKKSGGITSREMREIIGSFHHKTSDHIDKVETRKLAQEYIGGSRFMLNPKGEKRTSSLMNRRDGGQSSFQDSSSFRSRPIAGRSFGAGGIKLVR